VTTVRLTAAVAVEQQRIYTADQARCHVTMHISQTAAAQHAQLDAQHEGGGARPCLPQQTKQGKHVTPARHAAEQIVCDDCKRHLLPVRIL
jgi:hypothetical protein